MAYRKGDNGELANNSDNAVTVGGTYQIVQNMQLQLTVAKRSGNTEKFSHALIQSRTSRRNV